jgi:hypothetical protein
MWGAVVRGGQTIASLPSQQPEQAQGSTGLSFVIRAAAESRPRQRRLALRLDRINSAQLIQRARRVYWDYLTAGGSTTPPPQGVVLQASSGRVVFDWPTLLPDEQFIPGEWLQGFMPAGVARLSRARSSTSAPWSTPQH